MKLSDVQLGVDIVCRIIRSRQKSITNMFEFVLFLALQDLKDVRTNCKIL